MRSLPVEGSKELGLRGAHVCSCVCTELPVYGHASVSTCLCAVCVTVHTGSCVCVCPSHALLVCVHVAVCTHSRMCVHTGLCAVVMCVCTCLHICMCVLALVLLEFCKATERRRVSQGLLLPAVGLTAQIRASALPPQCPLCLPQL